MEKNKRMQAVKSKDSIIEITLRKKLWKLGCRYRKNYTKVTGKPDIVFVGQRIAVFCDSEFWHGKDWPNGKEKFHNNTAFWANKIERNIERDKQVTAILQKTNWTVLRFWGNDIIRNTDKCVKRILIEIEKKKLKE